MSGRMQVLVDPLSSQGLIVFFRGGDYREFRWRQPRCGI